ncbi:hypothetical protein HRbin04_01148 [archaeon HR04]|nr:hypothetical protein HRbin04_01148 [archaeon HR04]
MVAACMSAETDVGPVIASRSHSCSGNCADLPIAPTNISTAAGTSKPFDCITSAHAVSSRSNLYSNVPACMKMRNIPASIAASPALVMRNAFIPACDGDVYCAIPHA